MTYQPRQGLTRPDVLILLVLGSISAGMVLPALGTTRAASARETCRNNFRQIGQAALKYAQDRDGVLPPIGGGTSPSILVHLLPYTDQHQIAEELLSSNKPWHDPVNAKIVAKPLAFAICPDTPKPERLLEGKVGDDDFKAAPTDYTAVPLITEAIRDIFPPNHDRSTPLGGIGAATSGSRSKLEEITDGLTTTCLGIVEIADKPNQWQVNKRISTGVGMGGSGTWVANALNAPRGYSWDGKTFPGPCPMNCSNRAAVYSFHENGCNFLFADGSVRFLDQTIDVWVFYAVLTRRGGELLTHDDL